MKPPWLRAALEIAYAVLALALAVHLFLDAIEPMDHAIHAGPVDGSIDWIGARAFWEHVNPFSKEGLTRYNILGPGFGHPPTAPFWFLPLTRWGIEMTGIFCGYLTIILLILHLTIVGAELAIPVLYPSVALAFAWVAQTSWFRDHLLMAQLSEPIAFLYVLAWYFLRRQRDVLGGVMLGLATTFKLFPGLLVAWLLVSRKWRAFAAACIAWGGVAVVMTWRYGLACWPQFFRLQGPIADFWITSIRNASLHGIVLRLFRHSCEPTGGPTLPRATAVVAVLSVVLLVAAWWATRDATKKGNIDLPFAIFALLSAFLNPWEWEHYWVLLILPAAILGTHAWRGWRRRALPAWAAVAVALVLAACVWMLDFDIGLKTNLQRQYRTTHDATVHRQLHFYEVANWLPQVMLLLACGALALRESAAAADSRRRPTPSSADRS